MRRTTGNNVRVNPPTTPFWIAPVEWQEILEEAERQGRKPSWLVQMAWRIARDTLRAVPDIPTKPLPRKVVETETPEEE